VDAKLFTNFKSQFDLIYVQRELIKSFCGFRTDPVKNDSNLDKNTEIIQTAVATGNWGCGAFNGDIELKCKFILFKHIFSLRVPLNVFV